MDTIIGKAFDGDNCGSLLTPAERVKSLWLWHNASICDKEFINCEFTGNGITSVGSPKRRSVLRNIVVRKCKVYFWFTGVQFEHVEIDGMRTGESHVHLWACAFRHVRIRGDIGTIIISPDWGFDSKHRKRNMEFRAANVEFHDRVDWALDISEARAAGIEIRGGIPISKIIRDPEDQFIVDRKEVETGRWRKIRGVEKTYFQIFTWEFTNSGEETRLFVLGKRSTKYKESLPILREMKEEGILR